jgi:hypothetical protein
VGIVAEQGRDLDGARDVGRRAPRGERAPAALPLLDVQHGDGQLGAVVDAAHPGALRVERDADGHRVAARNARFRTVDRTAARRRARPPAS